MPTLEEREAESPAALKKRLRLRMEELGINDAFAEYMEMMEIYLLKIERRMARLETRHNLDSDDIL
ncbi:MAG: hypothetical protein V1793_01895 [Pseudomonadota bacterium]